MSAADRLRRACCVAAALLAAAPAVARAGAWVREPGTAYVRVSAGLLDTDRRFDGHGDTVPFDTAGGFRNTGYRDLAMNAYVELGVDRDWTLIADLTWKRLRAEQPSAVFTTWGTGDVRFGVRRALLRGPSLVAAAAAMLALPGGYSTGEYPALGSGSEDLTVALEVGSSGSLGWTVGELSWRARSGRFRDQIGGALGGGVSLASRLALRGEVRGSAPLGAGTSSGDARFDPAAVDPTLVEVSGVVAVRATRGLSVETEVRSAVIGENTLRGTRVSVALATSPSVRLWRMPR